LERNSFNGKNTRNFRFLTMDQIPISFQLKGKQFSGYFNEVAYVIVCVSPNQKFKAPK